MAVGVGADKIKLIDLEKQEFLHEFEGRCYQWGKGSIIDILFTPDSKYVIYRWEESIMIMSIEKLEVEKELECHFEPSCLEMSLDGKYLAVGSYQWTDKLSVFNMETKELVQTIKDARIAHH